VRFAPIVFMLVVTSVAGLAAAEEAGHVHADLVTDASADRLAGGFRIGVRLTMDDDWHVYWTNPGDAGLATEVTVELPAGFEAGQPEWPTPHLFESPGGITSYGYSGEVVIAVPVTPPVGATAPVDAEVAVSWLACRERCVLGNADLELALPVDRRDAESGRAALDVAAALRPRSVAPEERPFVVSAERRLEPGQRQGEIVFWMSWKGQPPGVVEWFPDPAAGIKVSDVRVRTRAGLTRIDAVVTLLDDAAPTDVRSVLTSTDGAGGRSAWTLDLPVRGDR